MPEDDAGDWLRPSVFPCPSCGMQLFRVGHSPFDDEWRVFCDSCPISVEVSFYDPVALQLQRDVPPDKDKSAFFDRLESLLRLCDCGGRFRFGAARRCFGCNAEVCNETGVDLFNYTGCELEDRDPTPAEDAAHEEWAKRFLRTKQIWA